jgi:hypothetical protein
VVLAIEYLGAVFTGRHWTEASDASLAQDEILAKNEESQNSPTLPMLDGRGDSTNRGAQDN